MTFLGLCSYLSCCTDHLPALELLLSSSTSYLSSSSFVEFFSSCVWFTIPWFQCDLHLHLCRPIFLHIPLLWNSTHTNHPKPCRLGSLSSPHDWVLQLSPDSMPAQKNLSGIKQQWGLAPLAVLLLFLGVSLILCFYSSLKNSFLCLWQGFRSCVFIVVLMKHPSKTAKILSHTEWHSWCDVTHNDTAGVLCDHLCLFQLNHSTKADLYSTAFYFYKYSFASG